MDFLILILVSTHRNLSWRCKEYKEYVVCVYVCLSVCVHLCVCVCTLPQGKSIIPPRSRPDPNYSTMESTKSRQELPRPRPRIRKTLRNFISKQRRNWLHHINTHHMTPWSVCMQSLFTVKNSTTWTFQVPYSQMHRNSNLVKDTFIQTAKPHTPMELLNDVNTFS